MGALCYSCKSIPSLALHVQFEKQPDPYINHWNWWDKYSKLKSLEITYD